MAKNLVIVESPAKAGTIEKYLGKDFQVVASMGHIRDLPSSKLGVDVEDKFKPTYVIPPKARKTLKVLKDALKGKEAVYLATDLDREGEAIAWHISQALALEEQKSLIVHRITFDEITKSAIQAAIAKPKQVNDQLVDAQQARRVLDRLVGYTLSPVLWKKVYKGLSAGRVQSVALRLIVDRERERQAFQPVEYWSIKADLEVKEQKANFIASLVNFEGKKIEQLTLKTGQEAENIVKELKGATYTVTEVEKKPLKRRPAPPHTTSTFQQEAVNRLGISSKRAMQAAQRLYEAGLITYMRTDSVALSSQAVAAIREYVGKEFGSQYVPEKPVFFQNKSKQAQEAHEAIRPTNFDLQAAAVQGEPIVQKVYDLIWKRALASQMADAQLQQTAVTIQAGKGIFRATGQIVIFPGFLRVAGEGQNEEILPELTVGQVLKLIELLPEQHFTEPPPRFSEATLIKSLEEMGIGRPSTYAPTIDTLVQRGYVLQEQRRFLPEEVGFIVTDLLKEYFAEIVDYNFTAGMEEKLDLIAEGKQKYENILSEFWQPFHTLVQENSEKIAKVDTTEETDQVCPNCGSPMLIKRGRFGKFLACSKFPDCKTTLPLKAPEATGLICPRCGKPLIARRARRGIFFGCSGYPECTVAIWKKEQLPNKIKELEEAGVELPHKKESLAAFKQ